MKAGHQSLILPANMGLPVPPFNNYLYDEENDSI